MAACLCLKVTFLQIELKRAREEIARLSGETGTVRRNGSEPGVCSETVCVSSPLSSIEKYVHNCTHHRNWIMWPSWCPICKRPLEFSLWHGDRPFVEPARIRREKPMNVA